MGWNSEAVIAAIVIIEGGDDGLFVYNGTSAAGNLTASVAAAAGADEFGNAYLEGITNYTKVTSTLFRAVNLLDGNLQFFTAASAAGPWAFTAIISSGTNTLQYVFPSGKGFAVVAPTGDTTGAADFSNIGSLVLSGVPVILAPGAFYLNSALQLQADGQLHGCGRASNMQPGSGFAGTDLIELNGDRATVRDIQITGGSSSTLASNPQINAITTQARDVMVDGVSFVLVNGYAISHLNQTPAGAHQVNHQPHYRNLWLDRTAGGLQFLGNSGSGGHPDTIGATLSDIHGNSVGGSVASGGGSAGNLDALNVTQADDFTIVNWDASIGSQSTGHSVHLVGLCSAFVMTGFDIGGFPTPASGSGQCGVKVESDGSGSPHSAAFQNGLIQQHDNGVSVQGIANNIVFRGVRIDGNNLSGAVQNSTGTGIAFLECEFGAEKPNGQSTGGATVYDLDWQSTGHGEVADCTFGSAIVAVSGTGVQGSVRVGAAGRLVTILDPQFIASGTAAGNQVTNLPALYRMPLASGAAVLVGGTVTISTALVTATTRISLFYMEPQMASGAVFVSAISAGTSFTITSTNAADTSVVGWQLDSGG